VAQVKNDLTHLKVKGNIKTITETDYDAKDNSMKSKNVSKFNADGNEVEFCTYGPDNALLAKSVFDYNDSGKLTDVKRFKPDGSLNVKTTFKFDEAGNKTEEYNYDAGGVLFMKAKNKYAMNGNRQVKDCFNEYGLLFLKSNYKFDKSGNEIEVREYDSHHGLKYTTTFSYESYDAQGNWTKRTTYKNNDPVTITDRTLE
jgi:hypothetical protein